jgi:hypothetical protein
LHDTILTAGMTKEDVPELRRRVREIVLTPVDEFLQKSKAEGTSPQKEEVTN